MSYEDEKIKRKPFPEIRKCLMPPEVVTDRAGDVHFTDGDAYFSCGGVHFTGGDTYFSCGDVRFTGGDAYFSCGSTYFMNRDAYFTYENINLTRGDVN